MAVLGTFGKVVFNRSSPTPVAVELNALNEEKDIISLSASSFRSGDLVEVASLENWPNANQTDKPLIPTYANTAGNEVYSEFVDYSTAYPSVLIGASRTIPYRNRLYVHVDALNRLSFYRLRSAALAGLNDATRESINRTDFPAGTTTALELRLVNESRIEARLRQWTLNLDANEIDTTGLGEKFFDGVKSLVQGGGTFDFEVDREARDTRNTAIINESSYANARCFVGVDENIAYADADIVGTAGSIANYGPNYNDSSLNAGTAAYDNADIAPRNDIATWAAQGLATFGASNLLRLLMNTNEQSEANVQFWMVDSDTLNRTSYANGLEPGDLYYEGQILITSSAVSVRTAELITGSASFVTVREVELREG